MSYPDINSAGYPEEVPHIPGSEAVPLPSTPEAGYAEEKTCP